MPRMHELKTWPEPFQAVLDERKHHEVRQLDRAFAVGDVLWLREWDPNAWGADAPESNRIGHGRYTGRQLYVTVTYITKGGMFGLPSTICVMSIERSR